MIREETLGIKISLTELAELCADWDGNGTERYQEHTYEGYSLFDYIYRRTVSSKEMPEEVKDKYFKYRDQ